MTEEAEKAGKAVETKAEKVEKAEKTGGEVEAKREKDGERERGEKKIGKIIGVVIAVILAVVGIIGAVILTPRDQTTFGDERAMWVGTPVFGYVQVPQSWQEALIDEDTAQYTDGNGYFVSFLIDDTENISAKEWAEGVISVLQESGDKMPVLEETMLGETPAFAASGYYEKYKKWLKTWTIETDDGKTRYIAIEGPEVDEELWRIPETYHVKR